MHEIELFFFSRWLLRRGRGNLIYSRSKHLHKTTFPAAVAVNLLILHTVTFERQRWQIRGEANKNKNRFPESNLSEVRDVQIRRLRNTANETSLAVFNLFSHRQLAQDDKELIMFSLFLTRTLCSALKHSPTLCHRSFRGSQGFDLLPTEDEFYPNDSPMSPQMQCITGRKLEENKKKSETCSSCFSSPQPWMSQREHPGPASRLSSGCSSTHPSLPRSLSSAIWHIQDTHTHTKHTRLGHAVMVMEDFSVTTLYNYVLYQSGAVSINSAHLANFFQNIILRIIIGQKRWLSKSLCLYVY